MLCVQPLAVEAVPGLGAYGYAETCLYMKCNELNETATAKDRNTISRDSGFFLFLVSL